MNKATVATVVVLLALAACLLGLHVVQPHHLGPLDFKSVSNVQAFTLSSFNSVMLSLSPAWMWVVAPAAFILEGLIALHATAANTMMASPLVVVAGGTAVVAALWVVHRALGSAGAEVPCFHGPVASLASKLHAAIETELGWGHQAADAPGSAHAATASPSSCRALSPSWPLPFKAQGFNIHKASSPLLPITHPTPVKPWSLSVFTNFVQQHTTTVATVAATTAQWATACAASAWDSLRNACSPATTITTATTLPTAFTGSAMHHTAAHTGSGYYQWATDTFAALRMKASGSAFFTTTTSTLTSPLKEAVTAIFLLPWSAASKLATAAARRLRRGAAAAAAAAAAGAPNSAFASCDSLVCDGGAEGFCGSVALDMEMLLSTSSLGYWGSEGGASTTSSPGHPLSPAESSSGASVTPSAAPTAAPTPIALTPSAAAADSGPAGDGVSVGDSESQRGSEADVVVEIEVLDQMMMQQQQEKDPLLDKVFDHHQRQQQQQPWQVGKVPLQQHQQCRRLIKALDVQQQQQQPESPLPFCLSPKGTLNAQWAAADSCEVDEEEGSDDLTSDFDDFYPAAIASPLLPAFFASNTALYEGQMSDTSSLLSHMSAEQPHSPSQSLNLGAFNTYGNALVTHTAW